MNWLLTEEFLDFSRKISEIHEEKKKLKQELKEYYTKIQEQITELENKAEKCNQEFEAWKNTQKNDEK